MADVTVVLIDNGDTEPEVWVFESPEWADKFAGVRGSVIDTVVADAITDDEAKRIVDREIKERRDEERCRQAGL